MSVIKRFCVSLFGALVMLGAHPVVRAKDPPASPTSQRVPAPKKDPRPSQLQTIEITGTRIRVPNLTSQSPITTVSSAEILDEGSTNIENVVNELPQVHSPAQTDNMANNATGVANIALRGLGPTRTLILIDGRRLGPGDPQSPDGAAADVNFIPTALVSGVDVLTGGASAVYGSDAVAGVVNFHLLRNFQGVKVVQTFNDFQHTQGGPSDAVLEAAPYPVKPTIPGDQFGGLISDTSIILGTNLDDDRGNVTMYLEYRSTAKVLLSTRNFEGCETTLNDAGTGNRCNGSSNSAYGNFLTNSGDQLALNPDGSATFVPFSGAYKFNSTPQYDMQRPDQRKTLGALGHFRLSQSLDVYGEAMFMDDFSPAQTAASGLFQGQGPTGNLQIPCNNPYLSDAEEPDICQDANGNPLPRYQADGQPNVATILMPGLRMAQYPRIDNLRHTDYRGVLGVRGAIGKSDWTYDVSGTYWQSLFSEYFLNDVSFTNVQNALNGCTAPGSAAAGCVPLDIFNYGGITPAMFNYVSRPGEKTGTVTESNLDANVSGDFGAWGIRSPWASDPVAASFGVGNRRDTLSFLPSYNLQINDLIGQGQFFPPISGRESVIDEYAEIRVPVIEAKPLVKSLNLDVAGRHSSYSIPSGNSIATNTFKIGADYAPTQDIRFRSSYNRAVRAPNLYELFFPNTEVPDTGYDDPCSGATPTASLAACEKTGVTPAEYGRIPGCPTLNCSALLGGNKDLRPETADTWTLGFVLTPRFLDNFELAVDYWAIRIDDYVTTLPGATIVDGCLLQGNSSLCSLIHRGNGGIIFGSTGWVVETNANIGYLRNRGIDVDMHYQRDIGGMGSLLFNLTGSYLLEQTVAGATKYDCAGLYGSICSAGEDTGPNFTWRHNARLTWLTPWDHIGLSARWRYLSAVRLDTNNSQPALDNGFYDAYDNVIPAYNYLDLSASWQVGGHFTLRAGCNNVMDKDPPFLNDTVIYGVVGGANQNTYTVYDLMGRELFLTASAQF
ncbi:MAG: TonB-dependent receptor [Steroidobacteraceae bacterium]